MRCLGFASRGGTRNATCICPGVAILLAIDILKSECKSQNALIFTHLIMATTVLVVPYITAEMAH